MAETEDISEGEKKVILIVTALLLLTAGGLFIGSYLGKKGEMVVTTTTSTITSPTTSTTTIDQKYIDKFGVPEGFELSEVIEEYVGPYSGFKYTIVMYRNQFNCHLAFTIDNESKEVYGKYLRENEVIEQTDTKWIYKLDYREIEDSTLVWWHKDQFFVASCLTEEESDSFAKFFIEKFPPTDELNLFVTEKKIISEENLPQTTDEWWFLVSYVVGDDDKEYGLYVWFPRASQLAFSVSDLSQKRYKYARITTYNLSYSLDILNLSLGPNYWIQDINNPFDSYLYIEHNGTILDLHLKTIKKPESTCGEDLRPFAIDEIDRYCSLTRVNIEGNLTIDNITREINGSAWIDHQTFAWDVMTERGYNYSAWEWFGINLDNGVDIRIGNAFYNKTLIVGGTIFYENGSEVSIGYPEVDKIQWNALDYWLSPHSNRNYSSGWMIAIPDHNINLTILPMFEDQEFNGEFWEGICSVTGMVENNPVEGWCYAELVYKGESLTD